MKPKYLFIHILAVLCAFPFMGTLAQAAGVTITVITTFDYPGTGNLTRPQKITDANDIVGEYVETSGAVRGFLRFHTGNFSAPIIEPNDTGNFTEGRGINNSRTVCGDYLGSDGAFHGFFLSGSTYTEYDPADSIGTNVLGISNAGDFCGAYIPSSTGIFQAFTNIGGAVTLIDISGATFSGAYQLNATNQFIGYFADSSSVNHGFYQDRTGTLHFPIDPPGSTGTILFGINDLNWMVGRYVDSAGVTHGLFFIAPRRFVTFDFTGSTFTSLNGINRQGFICGRYIDSVGIEHGILARAVRTAGDEPDTQMMNNSPVMPIRSSPAQPVKVPAS